MNHNQFQTLFDEVTAQERQTLRAKAGEYASGGNRLENFYGGAAIAGTTPGDALWGYLTKHLVSCREIAKGKRVNRAMLREKIGDARNYLVLLEALVIEQGLAE